MLNMRKEQVEVFEQASLGKFEDSMVEHVKKFFPNHYRIAGEPVIRDVIRHGITRAEGYGFTTERTVCLYITTMFMLGSNFDTDIMYPWAAEILGDDGEPDPNVRAERTADRALDFQKRIAGTDNRAMNRTFLQVRKDYGEAIEPPPEGQSLDAHLPRRLETVFPKKFEAVGAPAVERVALAAVESAESYGLTVPQGAILCAILMFLTGSAFDREPLLPWVREILGEGPAGNPEEKTQRLHRASMQFLDAWLA